LTPPKTAPLSVAATTTFVQPRDCSRACGISVSLERNLHSLLKIAPAARLAMSPAMIANGL
jgi:hypothetical protein